MAAAILRCFKIASFKGCSLLVLQHFFVTFFKTDPCDVKKGDENRVLSKSFLILHHKVLHFSILKWRVNFSLLLASSHNFGTISMQIDQNREPISFPLNKEKKHFYVVFITFSTSLVLSTTKKWNCLFYQFLQQQRL